MIENSNFQYIYRHFDGPFYIVAAKTFYQPEFISKLGLETALPVKYFAAHFPLYPALISFFAPFMGYLKSMIFVTVLSTLVLTVFFYLILRTFKITKHPLLLTSVFLFLPRFLVVRSVGAPEPLFLLLLLISLFFFEKKRYVMAGIAGAMATMTKSPGILLFIAYFLVYVEEYLKTKKINYRGWGIGLIPLGLLAVFGLYAVQYKDFFAYFNSGDNIHLVFPFSAFNFQKVWVGTAWLEDVLFYFFIYFVSLVTLWRNKYRSFFYFALVFLTATVFVQHRDIARYSLPLWPMAVIAFHQFLTSKRFLVVFIILLPAIFFYAWNFLAANVMPISNWAPYL